MMKTFLMTTAIALLAVPALLASILLGSALDTPAGLAVARVAGVALLALGVACWFGSRDVRSQVAIGIVAAMLPLQPRRRHSARVVAILRGHDRHGLAAGVGIARRAGGLVHRLSAGGLVAWEHPGMTDMSGRQHSRSVGPKSNFCSLTLLCLHSRAT
jgi:hypothetical protein